MARDNITELPFGPQRVIDRYRENPMAQERHCTGFRMVPANLIPQTHRMVPLFGVDGSDHVDHVAPMWELNTAKGQQRAAQGCCRTIFTASRDLGVCQSITDGFAELFGLRPIQISTTEHLALWRLVHKSSVEEFEH